MPRHQKKEYLRARGMDFLLSEEGILTLAEAQRAAREYRREGLYCFTRVRQDGTIDLYTAEGRTLGVPLTADEMGDPDLEGKIIDLNQRRRA